MAEFAVVGTQQLLRPGKDEDWEAHKPIITDLYDKHNLKKVMHIMETEHHFKATENQYKKRLSSWDLKRKRISDEVYYAILRKKREREELGKSSRFQLGEVDVDESKIERFQKRHKMTHDNEVPRVPTPTNLLCLTPPAIDRGLSHSPGARSPSLTLFDWFESFSEFRNRSVAGSQTIPVDVLSYNLRPLVQLDDSYEMQCRYSRMAREMIESDDYCDISCGTEHLLENITKLTDRNQNMVHGLIRAAVEYFSLDQHTCASVIITTFLFAMQICNTYARIGMPDYAMDKLDYLAQFFWMPPDRIDQERAGRLHIYFYSMYKMEQAFCMVSQGRDQEALATMNHVLGLPEDIDSVHFVASLGGCPSMHCRYEKLVEGADAGIDMISTVRDVIVGPTAKLIARQLQYRPVNIDGQNQGRSQGYIYDPVLTEGMEITESQAGDWETHDG